MKVLLVGYPFAPVADGTAGGAEQVLRMLEKGLADRGHETHVVAAEGSRVAGRLHPVAPGEVSDAEARARTWAECKRVISRVVADERIELVHFHGFDFPAYLPELTVPALATLHLPLDFHYQDVFQLGQGGLWFNCVSEAQRETCPASSRLLPTVPNGVELDRWQFSSESEDYAVWFGRICPEKGVHHAIEAARALDLRLILAGALFQFPAHVQYFEREILPRLDDRRVFLGALGLEERARLLRRARCLIVPTEARETSCLVAMEALASGTPVVALRRGAIPEIVESGRTGWVVDQPSELASGIGRVDQLDRATCRSEAEDRFDARVMVQCYEATYTSLRDAGYDQAMRPSRGLPA